MTYRQALEYIHSTPWKGGRAGLARTRELLCLMGRPQERLRFVHIAGTNGKGSTAAMLSSILRQAGYTTGLYTSPYIHRFNERMQVNGGCIPDEDLAALTEFVRPLADDMQEHPNEFELVTCLGLEYFCRLGCDIVVLEVGLGGRLDPTNVIDRPEAAVITAIGLDHTEVLGGSLEAIAAEKAGIVKPGGRVVLSGQQPPVEQTVREICQRVGAQLDVAQRDSVALRAMTPDGLRFDWLDRMDLSIPLVGEHQLQNVATVLQTVLTLRAQGWRIPDRAVRNGLAASRWPGRFEILRRNPMFIVDGGHNPQGAEALAQTLKSLFPQKRIVFLMGVLADKEAVALAAPIADMAAQVFTVTPQSPRALPAEQLARLLQARLGLAATPCGDIGQGVAAALESAGPDGVVCAFGSLYMVGSVCDAVVALPD
jgi:dihydrofolate synthase/folylpolyglutamate synthase